MSLWYPCWLYAGQFPMPWKTQLMRSFSRQLRKQADLNACPGFSSLVAKSRSWLREETEPHVLNPVRTARLWESRSAGLGSPASCCLRCHTQQPPTDLRNLFLSDPSPSVSLEHGTGETQTDAVIRPSAQLLSSCVSCGVSVQAYSEAGTTSPRVIWST